MFDLEILPFVPTLVEGFAFATKNRFHVDPTSGFNFQPTATVCASIFRPLESSQAAQKLTRSTLRFLAAMENLFNERKDVDPSILILSTRFEQMQNSVDIILVHCS